MIDRYTKEICRVTGIFIASMTLTPSLWDLDEAPAAFSEKLGCSGDNRTSVPSTNIVSFPESFEGFDEQIVLAIQDVVTLARAAQVLWDCHGVEVLPKDGSQIIERSYHLIHKLLSMKRRCVLLQINILASTMQECCPTSLLLWLLYILGGTSGTSPKNSSIKIRSILLEHKQIPSVEY